MRNFRSCHPFICCLVFVVCLVSAIDPLPICSRGTCEEGQKMVRSGDCIQCDKGTYMPFKNHSCSTCFFCSNVISPDEIIVAPCTARTDTRIVCKEGYFTTGHDTATTRSCTKCSECTQDQYTWRNCTETKDTGCRPATIATEAVMGDESTRFVNYFNTTETAIIVNETSGSHTSINTTTVVLDGKTNSCYIVLACILPFIVIIAILVIFRKGVRTCFLCTPKGRKYELAEYSSAARETVTLTARLRSHP